MKLKYKRLIITILVCYANLSKASPLIEYFTELDSGEIGNVQINGEYRLLELDGRVGVNPTSIHTIIQFDKHNLNDEQGTLTYWVFSLEEIFTFLKRDVMFTAENKVPYIISILTDHVNIGEFNDAHFAMTYEATWHPQFVAKFYKGSVHKDAIEPPKKAKSMASAFEIHRNQWYQITLSWNAPKDEYNIYVNGVKVAAADSFHKNLHRDIIGDKLYSGRPLLVFGELKFYNYAFSQNEARQTFYEEATYVNPEFQSHLEEVYAGGKDKDFTWEPDGNWAISYDRTLKEDDILNDFYVQGRPLSVTVEKDGLNLQTIREPYTFENTVNQMYLWCKQYFEGDIYIEYEFRPNQEFGLTLLVFQASGMSRENFMRDYEPRIAGTMLTIHSSDVRNYHLEYYRHMSDVRNDIGTYGLVKNPYQYPIGFATTQNRLEVNQWHKLQVLQRGEKITVAINGKELFTAIDRKFSNNGPVLTAGNIAFRCMINTDVTFRNLKVYNKKLPYSEPK